MKRSKYSPEVRERAVRMVFEQGREIGSGLSLSYCVNPRNLLLCLYKFGDGSNEGYSRKFTKTRLSSNS
jgi:hypothetical protein